MLGGIEMINVFGIILFVLFMIFILCDVFSAGKIRRKMIQNPKWSSWFFAGFILVGVFSQIPSINKSTYSYTTNAAVLFIVMFIFYAASKQYMTMRISKSEAVASDEEIKKYKQHIYNAVFLLSLIFSALMFVFSRAIENNVVYILASVIIPLLDSLIGKIKEMKE